MSKGMKRCGGPNGSIGPTCCEKEQVSTDKKKRRNKKLREGKAPVEANLGFFCNSY